MNRELKDTLRKRLDENYTAFLEQLQGKSTAELIAMAPEITAAQQCHEELLDACDDDDIAFLLQFYDPLEVVRGYWESEITGYDKSSEMGHMLWEIRDRDLYEQDQLIPVETPPKPKMRLSEKEHRIVIIAGAVSNTLHTAGQYQLACEAFQRVFEAGAEGCDSALRMAEKYVEIEIVPQIKRNRNSMKKEKRKHER